MSSTVKCLFCHREIEPGTEHVCTEQIEAMNELLRRQKALEAPDAFSRYMGTGEPAKHHSLILDELRALESGDFDILVVCCPPGSAKSTYVSIVYPLWLLARNPETQILLASHTATLSEKWSRRIRNYMKEPAYQVLTDTRLSEDSRAVDRWATAQGGEFFAVGTGGAALGFRADYLILDDPVSGFEEASSETRLAKLLDWFDTDAVTRLKPGGRIVAIQQRLAHNDLAGHLMRRHQGDPRLRTVILPMEAEAGDPLGREFGERLWPEWYTEQMVEDAKRDPIRWQTLYQQHPIVETGQWVEQDQIHYVDRAPDGLRIYFGMDIALNVGRGDWSVIAVIGIDAAREIWLLDLWRDRVTPDVTAQQLFSMMDEWRPAEILIEDDNASKAFKSLVTELSKHREQTFVPLTLSRIAGKDKETRAAPLRAAFHQGRVHIVKGAWNSEFHREVIEFPVGAHDDQIDAVATPVRELPNLGGLVFGTAVESIIVEPPVWSRFDQRGGSYVVAGETLGGLAATRTPTGRIVVTDEFLIQGFTEADVVVETEKARCMWMTHMKGESERLVMRQTNALNVRSDDPEYEWRCVRDAIADDGLHISRNCQRLAREFAAARYDGEKPIDSVLVKALRRLVAYYDRVGSIHDPRDRPETRVISTTGQMGLSRRRR